MAITTAPWTDEQVANLNRWQHHAPMHPFTCGSGNRGDGAHLEYAAIHDYRDNGLLLATAEGWICPVPGCDYAQDWAHDFMLNYTEEELQQHRRTLQDLIDRASQ